MRKVFVSADRRGARLLFLWFGGMLTGITLIFPEAGLLEWISLVPAAYVLLGAVFFNDEPRSIRRPRKTRTATDSASGSQDTVCEVDNATDAVRASGDASDIPPRRPISIGRAYALGFFFFMSFYTVIFHWFIYLYPLEFTGMTRASAAVVVAAGWIGLSLLQASVGGLVFVLFALIGRTHIARRHRLLMPFVAGALWVVFEWSQTLFWTGVPWGRLPIGQTTMPVMIQTASLFGSYFVTLLIISVNFCLALAIREALLLKKSNTQGAVKAADKHSRLSRYAAVSAASLLIGNLLFGVVILPLRSKEPEGESIRAALIQGNIASGEKWDMTSNDIFMTYAEYTRAAAADSPDIVIWPESAVPIVLENNPRLTEKISALAVECQVPILTGILTEDQLGNDYNSMVLFLPDGSISDQRYSKRRLVPFGEFMPMRSLLTALIPPLAEIAMLEEDVTPGADSGIIVHDGVSYGSLICFDSIYEVLTRDSVRDGAELLVVATNDSWFYDSAAGRMHNSQAVLRAVESGRYVLRAANTGISSVIKPTGEVVERLDAMLGGYIVADVMPRQQITLYTRTGNVFVLAAAIFCFIPAGIELLRRIRR